MRELPEFFVEDVPNIVERDLARHPGWVIVDDHVIGFAIAERCSPCSTEILWMAVRADRRGAGHGTMQLDSMLVALRADGVQLMEVKTLDSSAATRPTTRRAPSGSAAASYTPSDLIGSVSRAFRILEEVGAVPEGLHVKQIARRAHLSVATTYHLVRTLRYEGYLLRPDSGCYVLGLEIASQFRDLVMTFGPPPRRDRSWATSPGPSPDPAGCANAEARFHCRRGSH